MRPSRLDDGRFPSTKESSMLETPSSSPNSPLFRVVFLHGAGTGPWIWEDARARLEQPSVALSVPSDRPGTNPQRCADELLANPSFPAEGPIVLVLHSLAGVLERPLVQALGSRVVQVIHVATVAPAPGRSFASTVGIPANIVLPLLFRMNPRGLKPSPGMLLRELGQDLSEARRSELVARHRPELGGLFLEPVPSAEVAVPRTYVLCAKDRCVSPALQARIAKRLGAKVHSIEAGHLPMLAQPEEFAALLSRAVPGALAARTRETSAKAMTSRS
jgi:pimeloyl-ACP methyl ester carboxylesterase